MKVVVCAFLSLFTVTMCLVFMKLLQGSPFLSRCDSLKKKMAAFQCLMEDDEEKDEWKKNEENESAKSTLAKDFQNGQSLLKLLIVSNIKPEFFKMHASRTRWNYELN